MGGVAGNLIWNDPVKLACWLNQRVSYQPLFVICTVLDCPDGASVVAETAIATVDHSDIRGSKPHNRDPSGAASD